MTGTKNDKDMTGVLYGGVGGFWSGRCIIITTDMLPWENFENYRSSKMARNAKKL